MVGCKLLHPNSNPCLNAEMDLFSIPQTQVGVEESGFVEINTVSSYDSSQDSPIEFFIPSNSELFIDPQEIYLYVKVKLLHGDGKEIGATEEVFPENDLLSTLFSNVEIFLNDISTQLGPCNHALQCYVGNLLNYDLGAKRGFLSAHGHYENESDHKERFKKVADKTFDLYGKLSSPICNQSKLILNGVDVRIKMLRSDPAFYLRAADAAVAAKKPFAKILETFLMVRKVKLTPNAFLEVERKLRGGQPAVYPIDRIDTRLFTIAQGMVNCSIDNIVLGTLPKRVVVCLQNNNTLSGDYTANSFSFKDYDISNIGLYVNGSLLVKSYETFFTKDDRSLPLIARPYLDLMTNTVGADQTGNGLSLREYNANKTLFAFNLEAAYDDCFNVVNPLRSGEVSLKLQFRTALPHVVTVIIFLQFAAMIEINSTRNVLIKPIY